MRKLERSELMREFLDQFPEEYRSRVKGNLEADLYMKRDRHLILFEDHTTKWVYSTNLDPGSEFLKSVRSQVPIAWCINVDGGS